MVHKIEEKEAGYLSPLIGWKLAISSTRDLDWGNVHIAEWQYPQDPFQIQRSECDHLLSKQLWHELPSMSTIRESSKVRTSIDEGIISFLVGSFHGEIAGGEVGGREGVPRRAGVEKGLDDGGVAVLGRVHERSEAFTVEIGHVGTGVY
ncbi:hypothetical protein CFP56_030022 [Quercus suber]|uniref:Uncharacterized protein n=1 Tax=Quercus suber TaxID=58331 RepID=A0AAW0JPW2_QUESU